MPSKLQHWLRFVSVIFGCIVFGYLLAAYEVPGWGWGITLATLAYLIFVGNGGLLLANVWVLLLCSLGIYRDKWPSTWPVANPYNPAPQRAAIFLCIWLGAVILMVVLSSASENLQRHGSSKQDCLKQLGFWVLLSTTFGGALYWLGILG
ncbi:MAG: hypothetical protein AAF215_32635 [Cyanobacteria bacterium P01_A01_bin.123]